MRTHLKPHQLAELVTEVVISVNLLFTIEYSYNYLYIYMG